mmetsp:Transcript_7036/g.11820  ORF Transcript_7036/g.11820 Transcript_7036/m.11820 type:complete len:130 (-) Transcript_7036:422-811(-)|eukprot:CAMPEP_0119302762 /NCGR_PEP_ID=MMETSP1333-20130426/4306_1 /TAXON_ID=418940 /ORGANISM="Scyphosphaera apsteinii, Strain RCC1455" /LENGTH=129 /DNA_ID=CAMNT_0007305221 /DNA_START=37 /DNA_END=426 /DNA_ORIENTATION=+
MAAASLWLAVAGFAPATGLGGNCALQMARCHTPARAALFAPCMEMQELEFIIHADGRVEERVRGVKGVNCQEVSSQIEEALGEVYHTQATEEMFEVAVEASVNEQQSVNVQTSWSSGSYGSDASGSSAW